MVGRNTAALMKRAQMLAAEGDDSMIQLAEALSELRTLPRPPDGDRPTLDELASRVKLSRRTICYLLKVRQMVDDLGTPRERLVHIGWTKMAVLAENCEPEDVKDALELAETYTAKELPAALDGTLPKRKARTVKLRLTPTQYDQFAAVLLANGARRRARVRPSHRDVIAPLVAGVRGEVLGRIRARTSRLSVAPFRRRHPAHAQRADLRRRDS